MLVDIGKGRNLLDLLEFWQDLEELLGCRVDVITDGGISPYLRERIHAEALGLPALLVLLPTAASEVYLASIRLEHLTQSQARAFTFPPIPAPLSELQTQHGVRDIEVGAKRPWLLGGFPSNLQSGH